MFWIRRRIAAVTGHAHSTMADAQSTMKEAKDALEKAQDTLSLGDTLLLEMKDGITISFQIPEGHNLGDLLTGKTRKLPIEIRLELEEEEDK